MNPEPQIRDHAEKTELDADGRPARVHIKRYDTCGNCRGLADEHQEGKCLFNSTYLTPTIEVIELGRAVSMSVDWDIGGPPAYDRSPAERFKDFKKNLQKQHEKKKRYR